MATSKHSRASGILHIILLLAICCLAFGTRMYQIGTVPQGALIDEAHFGYLAYSLLETGKDEHSVSWPILFTGFGDYKLPMGAYVLMPFVQTFGLDNAVIRYPSVIAGTLLVLAAYLLVREVTRNKHLGLLAALVVSVSPWTFLLSRFGFESNLALCCMMFALWLMARGVLRDSNYSLAASGVLFAATWYAYIAYRPVTALMVVLISASLVFLHRRSALKPILYLSIPFILLVAVFFAPGVSKSNTARLDQVGIMSDPGVVMTINESRTFCVESLPTLSCYAVWNKPSLVLELLHNRYISSLSPDYLFLMGEPAGGMFSARGFAVLYSILLPFYLLGFAGYIFVREPNRKRSVLKLLFLAGLLLSPIPTVIAGDAQRVRISVLFPFILMTILFGVSIVLNALPKRWHKLSLLLVISAILIISFARYLTEWFGVHTAKYDLRYQSYVPELMAFVHDAVTNSNARVLIKPFFSDPLMFYAYYTKMAPAQYQSLAQLGELEASGFQHTTALGNLRADSKSPEWAVCAFPATGDPIYFVTDETLDLPLLYTGYSTNNVHAYVHVYDISSLQATSTCE